MPGLVMSVIRPMLKDCNTKTIAVFVQDVSEWLAQAKPETGFFDNYYDEWQRFLETCKTELDGRE